MLDRIESNGVRLILVEDASRFARSVLAQEAGLVVLLRLGVRVLTASGEDLTATDDPGRIAMRQMAGALAEFEKNRLVHKLRGARDRGSAKAGKRVEGRKATLTGDVPAMSGASVGRTRRPVSGAACVRSCGGVGEGRSRHPSSGKLYSAEVIRLALAAVKANA
jgi:hypothetical protein